MGLYNALVSHADAAWRGRAVKRLKREGFRAAEAATALDAVAKVRTGLFDVAIADEIDVIAAVREDEGLRSVALIFVAPKSAARELVRAVELGADFVHEPADLEELAKRTRLAMEPPSPRQVVGGLTIEVHRVSSNGRRVALTPAEMQILRRLAARRGRILTRMQLAGGAAGPRTVDVHVTALRRKLGAVIETVRGLGYRLRA